MKKKIFSLLALLMTAAGMNAETTVYSWESPSGTVSETGGTAAYVNGSGDNRVNYQNSGYYTICLNGKKANVNDETPSANAGKVVITLTNALAAGDVITLTAYITKNESKKSSAYFFFEKGGEIESAAFSDAANIDGNFNGAPQTVTVTVPEAAAGSKTITMTRGQTGTNLFITKLVITSTAAAGGTPSSEVTPVGDGNLLIGRTEHGTVAFKVGGNVVTDAEAGDNVNVVVTPDEGWSVGSVKGQWWAVVATSRRIGASGTIDLEKDFEIEAVTGTENTFAFEMKLAKVVVSVDYRKLLTNTDISVDNIASVTYTGEELKPAVTVMDGETVLVEGTDYTVDYTDNVNVGTATATITGIGKYDGEVVTTFDIDKTSSVVIAPTPCTLIYNGKVQTLINAGAAGGGVLQYSRDGANYSPELPQGLNAGIYTIFYKVFGDSNHNDSEPERMRVIIAPKSIDNVTVTVSQPSGSAVPTVTAKEGKVTLVEEEDYEISYKDLSGNNVTKVYVESNSGDYIAVITFIGNYSGTVEQQFTVQTTTAIIALSDSPAETAPVWYTLDGRKISTPTKQGVYIRNGKKVVVK